MAVVQKRKRPSRYGLDRINNHRLHSENTTSTNNSVSMLTAKLATQKSLDFEPRLKL